MNKNERIQAVLKNMEPDVVPAGFWFHYPGTMGAKETAEEHLKLFHHADNDIIKIMLDLKYPTDSAINGEADWYKLKFEGTSSAAFIKQKEIIQRILDAVGGSVMTFQTVFGAFSAVFSNFGEKLLMQHAREFPTAVAAAMKNTAETICEWVQGYMDLGITGIYYSAQYGEVGRFDKIEWETLVKPFDLMIWDAMKPYANSVSILHTCGEKSYNFKTHEDWYKDYPGQIANWSVKDNGLSLKEGQKLFNRTVLGGMNNKANIISGSNDEIRSEVDTIIRGFGSKKMILGADCTVQGKIDLDRIRTAVEAAHAFNNE